MLPFGNFDLSVEVELLELQHETDHKVLKFVKLLWVILAYVHILSYFTILPSLSLWVSYYWLVLINRLLCRLNSITES